jgi:hypothetical protein
MVNIRRVKQELVEIDWYGELVRGVFEMEYVKVRRGVWGLQVRRCKWTSGCLEVHPVDMTCLPGQMLKQQADRLHATATPCTLPHV